MGSTATIVVGIDGTSISRLALSWAARYAASIGGKVVAITVCPVTPVPHSSVPHPVAEELPPHPEHDARKAQLDAAIAQVAGQEPAVEIRGAVVNGLPGPTLCAAASVEDAVLLAVGSHGRGAVSRALLGSVSAYCVHHAGCPVIVMPATLDSSKGAIVDEAVDSPAR